MNKKTATRRVLATAGVCLAGAMLTACQSTTSAPIAASTTTVPAIATTSPVVVAATTTSAPVSTTPPPAPPTTQAAAPTQQAAVPTLGTSAWAPPDAKGYGTVKPATIFNGGDPSGLVNGVIWSGWGSTKATGSGTAEYIAPGQSDASGTQAAATVVAFDLGTCNGKLMYQEIEWYFPEDGQSFNSNSYINICTGAYHNM